jgi:uncharacterized protein (TIGR02284 family)
MSSLNQQVIGILNNLVATCKDGENGYRSAAEDVESGELKELFESYLRQRLEFGTELLAEIHRLDVAYERKGTIAALIHRGWMNTKAGLTRRDASTIIRECMRGEHAATKDYEQALKHELPPEIRTVVEKQYAKVKEAHDRMSGLKVIAVLNRLIATCKDGESGYRAAKARVSDEKLKERFDDFGQQRVEFAAELQKEVHRLGDTAGKRGTFAATMHRGWMGIKSALKGGDAHAVLVECERGEHAAAEHYREALEHDLPPALRTLVEKQYAKVKEAHDCISALQAEPAKV